MEFEDIKKLWTECKGTSESWCTGLPGTAQRFAGSSGTLDVSIGSREKRRNQDNIRIPGDALKYRRQRRLLEGI
jgi:hypothetical protein